MSDSQPYHSLGVARTAFFSKVVICAFLFLDSFLFSMGHAEAAIGTGGATCTASSKSAGTSLACTVAGESFDVGNVAVLWFAGDNTATVDGNDQLLSSVSDSQGNVWSVERCFTNSRGAANGGATTCIAQAKITSALTTSDTITANFSSITAKAISVREFTVGADERLRIAGTPQDDARLIEPQALTVTGLSGDTQDYLFARAVAIERTAPGTWSTTTNFTNVGCAGTSSGLNATNMEVCGEFQVLSTSSSPTSDPTGSTDDNASIYLAFEAYKFQLSGTVYSDQGFTAATGAKTIKIAFGTSTLSVHSTTTTASGTWSYLLEDTTNLTVGTPVVVWVDGESAFKASTFTKLKDNETSIEDLNLYRYYAVVRDDTTIATTTRLSELGFYDSADDSDIPYSVTGTTLLSVHSGAALYVAAGTIFNPEGQVVLEGDGQASATEGSLYVYGTYLPRATTTVAGNLYIDEGANFIPAPEGTVFNATTTHKYISVYDDRSVGNLWFTGSGGGWILDTSATTSDFKIIAGTVEFLGDVLRVQGDFTQNGAWRQVRGEVVMANYGRVLAGDLVSSDSFASLTVASGDTEDISRFYLNDEWVRAVVIDDETGVMFVGTGGDGGAPNVRAAIYRCLLSSGCDGTTDFSYAYSVEGFAVTDLLIDPVNRRLYASDSSGNIYHCLMSLLCATAGVYSTTTGTGESRINFLTVDPINEVLYAGSGSGGILYRCELSTNCNESGDFTTAYDTTETDILSGVVDERNGVLYLGTGSNGLVYRCELSTNCNESGDFTTAYDTAETSIYALAIDERNGVLYLGTGSNGLVYRCELSNGCDTSGDFTTAYDSSASSLYTIGIDTIKDMLYVGGASASFYTCPLSTGCDGSGDFSTKTLGSASGNIYDIVTSPAVTAVYIPEAYLTRFIDTASSTLIINDDITADILTIGANASATLPSSVSIEGMYANYGQVYAAGTTTFTGFEVLATGTLTGTSAFGDFVYEGHGAYTGGATSTFDYAGVVLDPSAGLDEVIDMTSDDSVLYVTGSCDGCGSNGGYAFYTVAYSKDTGEVLWATSTDPSSGGDVGQKVAVDDSTVYVNGYCTGCGSLGSEAIYLVAYDKATGVLAWSTTTDITSGDDRGVGISVDSDYLYINGRCTGCGGLGGNAVYTAKLLKSDRSLVWSSILDVTSSADYGVDIEVDGASVYGLGFCTGCGGAGLSAYYHYRLDRESGNLVWSTTTDPTAGTDIPLDMEMDGDALYATGYCALCGAGTTNAWYTVARSRSDGSLIWATSTSYESSGADRAYGIAVDGAQVYVAGRFDTVVDSVEQFAVVSYDKTTGLENTTSILLLNSSSTRARGIVVDGEYVYTAGYCTGCGTTGDKAYYLTKFAKDSLVQVDGNNTLAIGSNASTTDVMVGEADSGASNTVVAPTALSISGDYSNNGVFSAASGTVYFSSLVEQTLSGNLNTNPANTSAFHNLVLSGDGAKKPLAPLQATGDVSIALGTQFLASSTLTVGGDFSNDGIYTIATSTVWVNYGATTTNLWRSVTYGNGLFVAVGCENGGEGCDAAAANNVMTSPDGETWTMRTGISSPVQWRSVTYGNGLYVAVGCATVYCKSIDGATTTNIMTSPDGVTWSPQVSPFEIDLFDVTYGDGLFVAVGCVQTSVGYVQCWDGGSILTSVDGITWIEQLAVPGLLPLGVTYGNDRFVVVGCGSGADALMCHATTSAVLVSSDGLNWSESEITIPAQLGTVAYGNGMFVSLCNAGVFTFDSCDKVFYSSDGVSWSAADLPGDAKVTGVAYGNGYFVGTDRTLNSRLVTSFDGINWLYDYYDQTSTYYGDWHDVAFGNSQFVVIGEIESGEDYGDVLASRGKQRPVVFNGQTGTQSISGNFTGTSHLPDVILSDGANKTLLDIASTTSLTVQDTSGEVLSSAGLTVFGDFISDATFQSSDTVFLSAASNYAGVSSVSGAFSSSSYFTNLEVVDGIVEFEADATTTDFLVSPAAEVFMPGTLALRGDFTQQGTTSNFAWNWQVVDVQGPVPAGRIGAVTYGDGQFVAIGSGFAAQSSDGLTWSTTSHAFFGSDVWDIIYAEGLYVAVGSSLIITSPDGVSWTQRSSEPVGGTITYGEGLFVVVSDSPNYPMRTSPDGITWTTQSIGFEYLYDVTYGNGLFVAVGYGGTILTSTDGIVWSEQNSGVTYDLYNVQYGNGVFVASWGGRPLYSYDGVVWVQNGDVDSPQSARFFGGGQFLGEGYATYNGYDWFGQGISNYPIDADWTGFAYGGGKFIRTCLYDYVTFGDCSVAIVASRPELQIIGTTTQTLSGTLTGGSSFAAVTIGNDSAPVVFSNDASLTGDVEMLLPNTELQFAASQQYMFGSTTIAGTSGNEVLLRSSASGTRYNIDMLGDYDITYADIKDSIGAANDELIDVSDGTSVDSGNNSGWQFVFDPTDYLNVSGVVYAYDKLTPITGSKKITMALVATSSMVTYSTYSESSSGAFNFNIYLGDVVATATPLSVYIDNEVALKAVTVTKTSGTTTLTGVDIYEDKVAVSHDGMVALAISDLAHYDYDDDTDIPYTANSNILKVNRGTDLFIEEGKTFTPGGTVLASSTLSIGSGAEYDAPATTVLNGVYTNEGVYTNNSGTFTMSAVYSDILLYGAGRDVTGHASAGTGNAAVNAVAVKGNYLYVGKAGSATACSQTAGSAIGCELMVFDISSSTNPVYVAGRDTSGDSTNTGNLAIQALAINGNYLYVGKAGNVSACSQTPGAALGCELMVFDISSSTNPTFVYGMDASGVSNGSISQAVQSLAVYNNVLYVGKANSGTACSQTAGSAIGCEIMAFTANSYNITYVAGRDTSGSSAGTGNVMVRSLVAEDGYLYVGKNNNATACSQSAGSATGCEIMVFDISSTTNPTYAAGRDVSGSATGTGSEIVYAVLPYGDVLYVGKAASATACSQTAGSALGCELQVYDISTPTTPTYVAGRDVSASSDGVGSAITYSLAVRDGFLYAGSAGNTTACSQTAGSAIGCEVKAYEVSSTTNPTYAYGRDASGSATGTGSANANSIAVTRKGLYVGKAGSATACSQAAGSAIGCELHFYPVNFTDRGYLAGNMTGTSAFGDVDLSGTTIFLNNASTTDLTIATNATTTAPHGLSVAGDYTNNGLFTAGTGTVYFSGTSAQTATGSFTGVNGFNNLVFSGSGMKTFSANASTSDFTVQSGSGEVVAPETLTISGDYTNNSTTTMTGTTWTPRTAAEANSWNSVTYGNGLFVAVSSDGTNRVMTSPNGTTWTPRTAAGNNDSWKAITYGNGIFVAVGDSTGTGDSVMTSPDGTTWTAHSAAGDNDSWSGVTYGNGLFVAVARYYFAGAYFMYSSDGINWTQGSQYVGEDLRSVAYGNGVYVAVGGDKDDDTQILYTSTDGITWINRTSSIGSVMNGILTSVVFADNVFLAVSSNATNRVMTSPDGTTWTAHSAAGDNDSWYGVTYGNGLFVAVSSFGTDRVMTSRDSTLYLTGYNAVASGTMTGASQLRNVVVSGEVIFADNASTTNFTIATTSSSTTLPSAISIAGNYTNNGTVNTGSGTVYLSGSNPQTFSGQMISTNSFNNLYIQNNSRIGTTTFDAALTANSLTAQGSTYLAFKSGATTTVGTLTLNGSSTAPISFDATATTTQSNFVLTSTASVSYTTISNSSACGSTGGAIDVSGGSNTDGGNTDCWTFVPAPGEPSLSLDASYTFYVGQSTTTLGVVTVTESIEAPGITAAGDLRLTIATSTTNLHFDTTNTTPTFGGTASGKVSGTVSYADGGATVVVDVTTNFSASDTLTIDGLAVGIFASVSTTTSQLALHTDGDSTGTPSTEASETFRIIGTLVLGEHTSGQADNEFSWQNRTGVTLYAFNLEPVGETATVTDIVITLNGLNEIDTSDISNFALYIDNNSDGAYDAGDTLIDGGGIMTINGQFGAITFSTDFLATTTHDYLVIGDTQSIVPGASAVFLLNTSGVTGVGATSNSQPALIGSVSSIQHIRNVGGGGSNARIGGAAPIGNSVETGGESGGGGDAPIGQEPDGENIAYDPDFKKPTNTGTPNNEWTNGTNALASDGVYATAASTNLRQSFYNFGFSIPTGNSVQGIAVKLDASGSTADGTIDIALSWNNDSSYTSAKATPTLSGSDIVYTVGGNTDTWGRSWSPADFNDGSFILRVTAQPSSNTLRLDALEVRVYHQATGGGSGGGGRI